MLGVLEGTPQMVKFFAPLWWSFGTAGEGLLFFFFFLKDQKHETFF